MAPLTPTWIQPSHAEVQEVIVPQDPSQFTTKSISKVNLAPYAVFAKMAFPPCTRAAKATYATVQMGRDEHLNLNSDLVYINHSCDPSLIFDTSALTVLAGARGLKVGDELTFFYPSTEWDMDQSFDCFCQSSNCLGSIGGAKHMTTAQLEGHWLNAHIRSLLEDRDRVVPSASSSKLARAANGHNNSNGATESRALDALQTSLSQAREMVDAAQKALDNYLSPTQLAPGLEYGARRGVTSREMSGEMGGDTVVA